ncbi:MAG: hypothetical protein HRT70_08000 [Flavobacteriaceae bacterium]|nr:hypothetical protein [Flavobacteriaceae bacterium]
MVAIWNVDIRDFGGGFSMGEGPSYLNDNEQREREYFICQVRRYRTSLRNIVCNSYQMQSTGFVPIDILEIKRLLRETSRYFQMPMPALVHAYQRLRDESDKLTTIIIHQAG